MSFNLFTAEQQPATDFTFDGMRFECSPLALRYCYGCRRRRRAKNLTVQAFYDSTRFWCKNKEQCRQ